MPKVTVGIGINSSPPISRSRFFIRAAKVMRVDSLWAVDHWLGWFPMEIWDEEFSWTAKPGGTPHQYFDWATLLGYAAGRAGKLQLGVGVTDPTRHHPVHLAQQAMTLAHLTQRPPILGIGAGEAENIVPYGMDFTTPVARLTEALQIIRLCLSSRGPFDFEGDHFQLERAMLDLEAPPDRVPKVWVAAHGPRMLRLAGRYGDGWYPAIPMAPDVYAENLGTIRESAAGAGRDESAITPGLSMFYAVAPSIDEAAAMLDSPPFRFFALLAPHDVWDRLGHSHPLGSTFRGLVDFIPQHFEGPEIGEAMATVPLDVLEDNIVWGTPDLVVDKLDALVQAGLRHVTLVPVSALVSPALARYAARTTATITRAVHRM